MKTLLLSFLTMAVQLVSSTYPDGSNPSVICRFAGDSVGYSYVFNVTDIQIELKGCDAFYYATYYFDEVPVFSTGNENAIKVLVDNNFTVYIGLRYKVDYHQWVELLYPDDNAEAYPKTMDPLVKFLKKNKISGVVMEGLSFYYPDTDAPADRIADFANRIKAIISDMKVGLRVSGSDYKLFTNITAFDYNATNSAIDDYFIDLAVSNFCNDKTKHTSINPISSNDSSLITLTVQTQAVLDSAMDKSKVIAELQVNTILSVKVHPPTYQFDFQYGSYSELCSFTNNEDIVQFCSDYTDTFYKQGQFARQHYSGIMLTAIEGDDTYGNCNCGRFIVSKAITSGWYSNAEPNCTKLDGFMKI